MNIKSLTVLSLFFLLWCCNTKHTSDKAHDTEPAEALSRADSILEIENSVFPIQIDPRANYEKKGFVFFQDICKVEYIPLETNENCLLGEKFTSFGGMFLDDENLFILSRGQIFRFDRKGKFINTVGKRGQGPGEIALLSDFKINEETKEVLILDGKTKHIHFYTYNGTVKKSIPLEFFSLSFDISGNNQVICAHAFPLKHAPMIFSASCNTGETVSEIYLNKKPITGKTVALMNYYTGNKSYNNKYICNIYLSDTIFCVDKKTLELHPRYIRSSSHAGPKGDDPSLFLLFETDRYANLLISNGRTPDRSTYIVDKKANKIYNGLFGDIERGTSVVPINTNRDNIVVDLYEAHKLTDLLSNNLLSGKLKEIAETLDDEDNPVLMIATFRQ